MDSIDMKIALSNYSGKRVLVTGHTGFKGAWLVQILKILGANVAGFALPPSTEQSHFESLGIQERITNVFGDIRDLEKLQHLFDDFKPEVVFHLAAQALVKDSYSDPISTYQTNVIGSANVLEAVRQCSSVRALVYVTSDKCYENFEWEWGYRESDPLGGRDPYSASKAAAELIFSSYSRSFFENRTLFGAASVRAGNVIGGGDWSLNRIIPDCVRAFQDNGEITLRNPKSTRPWQHVLEPLSGYLLIGANLLLNPSNFNGAWNFGPPASEVRTVFEVATVVMKHLEAGRVEIDLDENSFHEAKLLQLNCDRASQLLGWTTRWNIEKTLDRTATWYKEFHAGKPASEITDEQIYEYFTELK